MGGVHKSIRLDNSLVERLESLKEDSESLSETIRRALVVGCDVLQGGTDVPQRSTVLQGGTDVPQNGAQGITHDGAKLIEHLEHEIARLEAEHDADRAAIAQKDEQLARALEKAHELAGQAHVLMGMTQRADALPTPTAQDAEGEQQIEPKPKKGFWRELFGL